MATKKNFQRVHIFEWVWSPSYPPLYFPLPFERASAFYTCKVNNTFLRLRMVPRTTLRWYGCKRPTRTQTGYNSFNHSRPCVPGLAWTAISSLLTGQQTTLSTTPWREHCILWFQDNWSPLSLFHNLIYPGSLTHIPCFQTPPPNITQFPVRPQPLPLAINHTLLPFCPLPPLFPSAH